MVRDNERCGVSGCTSHRRRRRSTPLVKRDLQIRDDWASGEWSVEELSSFWGLKSSLIFTILEGADPARAHTPALEVAYR